MNTACQLKVRWIPATTLALCMLALSVFLGFEPSVFANDPVYCYYAGQKYSNGACRDRQRCANGEWLNGCD